MDQLLLKMMEYDSQDAKRIQHFIKVHEFARLIGRGYADDIRKEM